MVGNGRPDSVASAERPITPPLPARVSRMVNARSMDCTPPDRCLACSARVPPSARSPAAASATFATPAVLATPVPPLAAMGLADFRMTEVYVRHTGNNCSAVLTWAASRLISTIQNLYSARQKTLPVPRGSARGDAYPREDATGHHGQTGCGHSTLRRQT